MGCFSVLLALISPRLALAVLWIFTLQVDEAFESIWVPIVGFFIFPWATFIYALLWLPGGLYPLGWLLVIVGAMADVSSWGASSRRRREVQRRY